MKQRIALTFLALVFGGLLFCQTAPAQADEPPLWMVGNFRAYNKKYHTDVQVNINADGSIIAKSKRETGPAVIQRGTFEGRKLIIENMNFDMKWRRDGFRMTQRDDPDNTADFTRMDDYDARPQYSQRAPSWLLGVWKGENRKYHARMTFLIDASGRMTAIARFPDGHETIQRGSYNQGDLLIDGQPYQISRRGEGAVWFRQRDDTDNINDVRHTTEAFGRDPDADIPPTWLVNVFAGHNNRYNSDIRIEIQPSGKVVSRINRNGNTTTGVGTYRRGRIRIVGGATYDVERTSAGVRLLNVDDENDADEYRRR